MVAAEVDVRGLGHRYGDRIALRDLSLSVPSGSTYALVGPNGSGKTTLFRLLSTLLRIVEGEARIAGLDVRIQPSLVRRRIGIVFQHPSLDRDLTVEENLRCQGRLYGLASEALRHRIVCLLGVFGLEDRRADRAGRLSGGLARRVEIAKALLHEPSLVLMDEPTTGLDPAARADFWAYVRKMRDEAPATVLLTTHLMDEAERCDRVAILDGGRLVAEGRPSDLSAEVGGDVILVEANARSEMATRVAEFLGRRVEVADGVLRIEVEKGADVIPRLVEAFPGRIRSVSLRKPNLEDVFFHKTGRLIAHAVGSETSWA